MFRTTLLLTSSLGCASLLAEITTPSFISDGMVLQQKTKAKLWGKATPNQSLSAKLGSQTLTTNVDKNGDWSLTFENLKASTSPQTLTLSSGDDEKIINDVLVGEVWIASGQSNMEWTMAKTDGAQEAKTANDPLLRVYVSSNKAIGTPQYDLKGNWKATAPENTPSFTAVGYQFAKKLRSELQVPVGIIETAWGGKPVEAFTSAEAIAQLPAAKALAENKAKQMANYQKAMAKRPSDAKGKAPANPGNNPNLHSNIYNGHIAPLVGYGIRGAIWYQGESNARPNTAPLYADLQAGMIQDWRTRWGHEFPFYYVQLANFAKWRNGLNWVIVQDQQRRMLQSVKHTGMAVTNDIGDPKDIHPKNKTDVGKRLARWALHNDYGKTNLVVSGPLFASAKTTSNSIEISFDHAEGLTTRDKHAPKTFEIAGADGKWAPANAKIQGNKVILTSDTISKPIHARYAWSNNPTEANLVNKEGLPTSCFTTQ
ncbi:sialate O-acetylesterase [Rubritalea tangerina]|uniref:Sialate O-acetylesterase n=2 Tax=Rubritalea tangerina TaxID=430798 RepID=A0ABW4ZFR0_9BACT